MHELVDWLSLEKILLTAGETLLQHHTLGEERYCSMTYFDSDILCLY